MIPKEFVLPNQSSTRKQIVDSPRAMMIHFQNASLKKKTTNFQASQKAKRKKSQKHSCVRFNLLN